MRKNLYFIFKKKLHFSISTYNQIRIIFLFGTARLRHVHPHERSKTQKPRRYIRNHRLTCFATLITNGCQTAYPQTSTVASFSAFMLKFLDFHSVKNHASIYAFQYLNLMDYSSVWRTNKTSVRITLPFGLPQIVWQKKKIICQFSN